MDEFKQIGPCGDTVEDRFPSLSHLIQTNGKSVTDLLGYDHNRNSIQLSKVLGRSIREIDDYSRSMKEKLSRSHQPNRLRELLEDQDFVQTGLPNVDRALGGGIPVKEITEVFGASGTGKSHFLLQLSLQCQLKSKECIYIATESFLETKRLGDIQNSITAQGGKVSADAISYIYCQDLEIQDHILYTQLPTLLHKNKDVGLVVIDSIAQHLRRENGIVNSDYLTERIKKQQNELENCTEYQAIKFRHQQNLKKIGKSSNFKNRSTKILYLDLLHRHLLRIAKEHNVAIVVVNQVSDFTSNLEHDNDPLNLDFQMGFSSGWDMKTIFEQFRSNVNVKSAMLNISESEIIQNTMTTRRVKIGPSEVSKRVSTEQQDLVKKLWEQTIQTKKHVPTLGYPWTKRIHNRIMFMKFYKPSVDEQVVKIDTEQTPVGLSGECSSLLSKTDLTSRKRGFEMDFPLEGWKVERYVKVVSAYHNPSNVHSKFRFLIDADGLKEQS